MLIETMQKRINEIKQQDRKSYYEIANEIGISEYSLYSFMTRDECSANTENKINSYTLDNRKCNLCIVSKSENQQNLKPNKYGCRGIYKSGKKFKASIRVNQKDIYLGTFENIEGAINARKNAELIYWTHPKKLQIIKGDNNE